MPSVVRSTFVLGAFAFAAVTAITACGDKVNVTQPTKDTSVQSVLVSPPGPIQMKVGDKVTFAASVTGGADLVNKAVTWKSSATNVATVDANGVVTAVAGGTASIIATSVANTGVSGAAVVQVAATVPATVTIGQINQTSCAPGGGSCTSVPATLSNVANQLDVTLNVDPGTQTISEVDLIMNCTNPPNSGQDTVVQRQTLGSSNVAPIGAEAATAPVTLSFNTAAFNSTTGVVSFKNGACTLKAKAITSQGTQSASGGQQLTLNNVNVVIATLTTTPSTGQKASATDAAGLLWRAGAVNVTAVPVLYTPGSIASGAVSLVNAGAGQAIGKGSTVNPINVGAAVATIANPTLTAGVFTATFPNDSTAAAAAGVGGAVVPVLSVAVTTVDNTGNPGPTIAASATNFIRLDNRAPNVGGVIFTAGKQNTSNGWVGKAFVFSVGTGANDPLSPGNTTTDNTADLATAPGVDNVTTATQFAPSTTKTWTTFTSVTSLAETGVATGTAAYDLRLQVCDALGNCANTPVLTTFGVDLTPPVVLATTGPKDKEIVGFGQSLSTTTVTVNPSDPQGANGVQGSGFGGTPLLVTETRLAPKNPNPATDQTQTCVIGTGTAPACKAALNPSSFTVATAVPGEYVLTYTLIDQAGNQSAPATINYYLDQAAPSMSGGISIPATITNGSVFTASGVDDMDFNSVNAVLAYPAGNLQIAGTSSATGVAFDNVLTRASTATVTLSNFYRSLGQFDGAGAIIQAQAKPTQIAIRGVDAAGNLSTGDIAAFPATNIANSTSLAGTTAGFILTSDAAQLCNTTAATCGTPGMPRSANLSATVNALGPNSNSPFSQVCFYVANPGGTAGGLGDAVSTGAAGELFLISCTSVQNTQPGGPFGKVIVATVPFDPAAGYGTAGSLNVFAIGVTANGDAMLASASVAIGLNP